MERFALRWVRRPWFAVLLLAALGARAAVPAGFMPANGELRFCDGHGPLTAAAGVDPHAHHHHAGSVPTAAGPSAPAHAAPGAPAPGHPIAHDQAPCSFAAAAAVLAVAFVAPSLPPALLASPARARDGDRIAVFDCATAAHRPRGPPAPLV